MRDAIVRLATEVDLPALGRLGAMLVQHHVAFDARRFIDIADAPAAYERFLRSQLRNPEAIVLVAQRDDAIVGYAFASIEPESIKDLRATAGFIHDLLIDEPARGTSIGTTLVNATIDWLRAHGVVRVMLGTAQQNLPAQRLFTKLGFRPTMIEMTKELE
jgi:GNAT superfamily N-acetyltransferase